MRTFFCRCNGRLFFHSGHCVNCGKLTALCPACHCVVSLESLGSDSFRCDACARELKLCRNRQEHGVCNGARSADDSNVLCHYCRLNSVIPDLAVEGNREKWQKIEHAKHRVLFDCQRIGLPVNDADKPAGPPLRFEFKSSASEHVSTGRAGGVITLDINEADSVHREMTRVNFDEPQRTLVGHFRHELGHYYWERIVRPGHLDSYRRLFGDERNPSYAEAREKYYREGAPDGWRHQFISRYASMHSWEDFAETFNAYLDMVTIIGTAAHFERLDVEHAGGDFDKLLRVYTEVGIVANELNRDIGLLDLVPEVFTPRVIEKLRFIHNVIVN